MCRTVYVVDTYLLEKIRNSLVHDFIDMFFCYFSFERISNTPVRSVVVQWMVLEGTDRHVEIFLKSLLDKIY